MMVRPRLAQGGLRFGRSSNLVRSGESCAFLSSSVGKGGGSSPHPVHWKGHNLKPLRIKKHGIEILQVRE